MKWNVNLHLFILNQVLFQSASWLLSFFYPRNVILHNSIQGLYTYIFIFVLKGRIFISVLEIRKQELKISQDKQFKWTELEPSLQIPNSNHFLHTSATLNPAPIQNKGISKFKANWTTELGQSDFPLSCKTNILLSFLYNFSKFCPKYGERVWILIYDIKDPKA